MSNDTKPVTVELPGTPPEGHEFVAAFKTPVPLEGMTELCRAVAKCYGDDAKLIPGNDWVAITARIDRASVTEFAADVPRLKFRVSETEPQDAADGMEVTATSHDRAAGAAIDRHADLGEYPVLWVWERGTDFDKAIQVKPADLLP